MRITLQYFDGCPNWKIAAERIDTLVADRADIAVDRVLVDTFELAEELGFHGSPTVLVDGRDPFAAEDAPVGLTCRMYTTEAGREGAPSVDQLRAALAAAN